MDNENDSDLTSLTWLLSSNVMPNVASNAATSAGTSAASSTVTNGSLPRNLASSSTLVVRAQGLGSNHTPALIQSGEQVTKKIKLSSNSNNNSSSSKSKSTKKSSQNNANSNNSYTNKKKLLVSPSQIKF